jgi:uncharacterized protein (DUF433 family)
VVLTAHLSKNLPVLLHLQNQTLCIIQDREEPAEKQEKPQRQHQRRLNPVEAVALVQDYRNGTTINDLAERYGIHRTTASGWIQRLAIPAHKRGLDPEDLPEAIEYYQAGWSLAKLGEHYSCNAETVRTALKRADVQLRPRRGW